VEEVIELKRHGLSVSAISELTADIHLVAPTPADVAVEELLDFSFNPFNPFDRYLYAADPLKLRVIRIDLMNGSRQVVAVGPKLFDFRSS